MTSSSEKSERVALFLYIADDLDDSCRSMNTEMRRKVDAIRRTRGTVEEKKAESAAWKKELHDNIAEDPSNPNLPHLREDFTNAEKDLAVYRKASESIIPWFKTADPELYAAALKKDNAVKHFFCNCHGADRMKQMREEDEKWIESLAKDNASRTDSSTTSRKRTRTK
jgi:hypothetical protein